MIPLVQGVVFIALPFKTTNALIYAETPSGSCPSRLPDWSKKNWTLGVLGARSYVLNDFHSCGS